MLWPTYQTCRCRCRSSSLLSFWPCGTRRLRPPLPLAREDPGAPQSGVANSAGRTKRHTLLPLIGGLLCLSAMAHLITVQCWGQEDLRVDVAVCRNAASSRSGLTFLPYSGLQGVVANR